MVLTINFGENMKKAIDIPASSEKGKLFQSMGIQSVNNDEPKIKICLSDCSLSSRLSRVFNRFLHDVDSSENKY